MHQELFKQFLRSENTLNVYEEDNLIFVSDRDRLLPLLDYLEGFAGRYTQVVVFDKLTGNAAALLCIMAHCREIYSPLGSQLAVKTLDEYHLIYHFNKVVPFIQQANRKDMCPMEKLSIGKRPEEFYHALKARINN
jgi:threonine aldolase